MKKLVPSLKQFFSLPVIISFLVGAFLFGSHVVFSFAEPFDFPPNANVSAPLNVSSTGQSKTGGLILNTGGAANGLIVQSGNVGIGTINPIDQLNVAGIPLGGGLSLESSAAVGLPINTSLKFVAQGGSPIGTVRMIHTGTGTNYDMTFETLLNNGIGEKMRITNQGWVGIGTTNPTSRLHIKSVGLTPLTLERVAAGSDTAILYTNEAANPKWRLGFTYSGERFFLRNEPNTEVLTVLPSGNVGIETINPTGKLHVAGIASGGGLLLDSAIAVGNALDLSLQFRAQGSPLGTIRVIQDPIGGPNYAMAFETLLNNGIGEKMRITNQGWVGIGTVNPSTKLDVVGTITGTTKNFSIDHPLKPGYKLIHSTLEGPEVAVFYRGKAQLVNGEAVVELPEYFESLTMLEGRTVQLTPVGGYSPLFVDSDVANGRFTVKTISGGNPTQTFYWEVKAVRKDVPPLTVEKKP